jgi:hypothetical protein
LIDDSLRSFLPTLAGVFAHHGVALLATEGASEFHMFDIDDRF